MALKHALIIAETVGRATIRFKCGPAPVTLALNDITTAPGFPVLLVLPNNTTIDGGGLITLDGTFTATVAFVNRDTTGPRPLRYEPPERRDGAGRNRTACPGREEDRVWRQLIPGLYGNR
jgi:hypothetical protein